MHYVLLDKQGNIPGYPLGIEKPLRGNPIYFNYDFDRETYHCLDDSFASCKGSSLSLMVKHKIIDFEYYPAPGNSIYREFFISRALLDIVKKYNSSPYCYRPIRFYRRGGHVVSNKHYYVVSFYDTPLYVNREKCLYAIPNGHEVFERILVKPSINYEILNKFDVVPSVLPNFPRSLIVSDRVKCSKDMRELNLNFLPLDHAPLVIFKAEYADVIDIDKLKMYTESDLKYLKG